MIFSMHDLNLASIYADWVALLSDGALAAIGTPAEVLTSERLSQVYIDYADLVTEMKLIKHPFKRGVKAQSGVEF